MPHMTEKVSEDCECKKNHAELIQNISLLEVIIYYSSFNTISFRISSNRLSMIQKNCIT